MQGIAWSADDAYLASVGLDRSVRIWSGASFECIARLDNAHNGWVKGVVFDPVGQYVATQADDQTLRVFRTSDWQLVQRFTEPFEEAPSSTFARLDWSPDGNHLVAANATSEGPVLIAAVLQRQVGDKPWTSGTSLVGHVNVVEVVAFNPVLFVRDQGSHEVASIATVVALGAGNCLSIWSTVRDAPIVVLEGIVARDILDLSWSKDGTVLYACSSDGHAAVLKFSLDELGFVAPDGLREKAHKTFGFTPKPRPMPVASTSFSMLGSQPSQSVGTHANPNILKVSKGKKKHITLNTQPFSGASAPQPSTSTFAQASTSASGGFAPSNAFQPPQQPQRSLFAPPIQQDAAPPMHSTAASFMGRNVLQDDVMDVDAYDGGPYFGDSPRVSKASDRARGRTLGEDAVRARGARRPRIDARELVPARLPAPVREVPFDVTNRERSDDARERWCLAVPSVRSVVAKQIEDGEDKDTLEWRNFSTPDKAPVPTKAEVGVVRPDGSKTLWLDYLNSFIVAGAGSPEFVAVSTDDGALHVYSPAGRRLMPSLVLDAPCAYLVAEGHYLMAITALGSLTVWDVKRPASLFPPLSVSTLLSSSATADEQYPTIATAGIIGNGAPLLALTSGVTVTYSSLLSSWTKLADGFHSEASEFWEGRRGKAMTTGRGVVRAVESAVNDIVVDRKKNAPAAPTTANVIVLDSQSTDGGEKKDGEAWGDQSDFELALSLGHLETRMSAAIALDSPGEYKLALQLYARKIADEGLRNKADELVHELIGPIYFKPGRSEMWSPTLLTFNKRDLLKEVLGTFARSRLLAKLGQDYQDTLKRITQD